MKHILLTFLCLLVMGCASPTDKRCTDPQWGMEFMLTLAPGSAIPLPAVCGWPTCEAKDEIG